VYSCKLPELGEAILPLITQEVERTKVEFEFGDCLISLRWIARRKWEDSVMAI
jgi:hypothetical protein